MFDTLLAWVALVEGLGIFALAGLMLIHALGLSWLEKRSHLQVEEARSRLLADLETPEASQEAPAICPPKISEERFDHLRALTREQQFGLFSEIIPNLKGSHQSTLTRLAGDIGLIDWAERLCNSRFWWRRLKGIRLLTLLDGGEDVVPDLLQDIHPAVRRQAVEWAATHPTTSIIRSLLEMLDNRQEPAHFSIKDSLLRMGYPATEPIRRALKSSTANNLCGVLEVAIGLASPQFLSPALELCSNQDPFVRALAAKLLGALGGGEAGRRRRF